MKYFQNNDRIKADDIVRQRERRYQLIVRSNALRPPNFAPRQRQAELQSEVMPSHERATQIENHMYRHRPPI